MEEQVITIDEEKKDGKKKKSRKFRRVACITFILSMFLMSCVMIGGFFVAGGWAKDMACSVVLTDSYLSNTFDCPEDQEVTSTEGEYIELNIPEEITSSEDLITQIIEEVSPAVVTVAVDQLTFDFEKGYIEDEDGIGSGFIIDPDGLIVTNQHVVSDENASYSVILPGDDEPVEVTDIYRDRVNDIALLRISKTGLRSLKLGSSEELKRGNLVIAIGNPFGDLEGTATVGYVTGVNRDVSAGSGFFGSVTHYEGVIQTDAAINPGNSGGPLINSKGEVVGINFATTQGADNISFAIPINRLKDRLEIFEQDGRFPQPYIGISYRQRAVYLKNQVLVGAVVYQVEPDGPADKAGLKRGDIILEADGKDLAKFSFAEVIQTSEVGEKLKLTIWREGETLELEVVVGDKGE